MSATVPPRIAEAAGAIVAAILATVAFVVWRADGSRWAGTLPGHLLGIVGIALMLWAGFGYSWRKRRPGHGAPPMAVAMQSHVTAGLLGPYLVILHSGLAFRGVAGVLALLTVVVVASGVVGRAVFGAVPRKVVLADPVRAAMLDAEMARLETSLADLARQGAPDPSRREALRLESVSLQHEQDLLRTQWRQVGGAVLWRRVLSAWWFLHVPASMALWVLAIAHVAAALYYSTFSR